MFKGEVSEQQMAELLLALNTRGVTPAELAGFIDAMRAVMVPVPLTSAERARIVDTCGTGGDASGTFNISTGAALVAAAAGATVAKHGNRAITSRTGSADVLEVLGIPVNLSPDAVADALRKHRFAFLLAPNHHPAMKTITPVRKALKVRTVFNILGPLSNPALAPAQLMGVYAPELVPLVAEALAMLGTRHALVVHGDGNLDELALSGPSQFAEVRSGTVRLDMLTPQDVGLHSAPLSALTGGDVQQSAAILRRIFAGEKGPCRDIVLLNTAAVLFTAGIAPDIHNGVFLAAAAIDDGRAAALVAALAQK